MSSSQSVHQEMENGTMKRVPVRNSLDDATMEEWDASNKKYYEKLKEGRREIDKAEQRKQRPVYRGVLKYFPDAIMEVANCSYICNEQHNPGEPMHWAKEKSTDEHDALVRHLMEAGTVDSDGIRHSTKVAWRALAALQRELEAEDV